MINLHCFRRHVLRAVGVLAVVLAAAGGARPAAAQAQYTVTDIGTLPAPYNVRSYPNRINDSGTVVGNSVGANAQHGYRWQNGVITDLGTLGGPNSEAYGIDANGDIVGWAQTSTGNYSVGGIGTLWPATSPTTVGPGVGLDGNVVYFGVNDLGDLVGQGTTVSGQIYPNGNPQAWLDILSGGVVASSTILGTFGGPTSIANAVNNSGQIVGAADWGPGAAYAFLWQGGTKTNLGTLPYDVGGLTSAATGINAFGQVVGDSDTPNGRRAFIWDDLNGM